PGHLHRPEPVRLVTDPIIVTTLVQAPIFSIVACHAPLRRQCQTVSFPSNFAKLFPQTRECQAFWCRGRLRDHPPPRRRRRRPRTSRADPDLQRRVGPAGRPRLAGPRGPRRTDVLPCPAREYGSCVAGSRHSAEPVPPTPGRPAVPIQGPARGDRPPRAPTPLTGRDPSAKLWRIIHQRKPSRSRRRGRLTDHTRSALHPHMSPAEFALDGSARPPSRSTHAYGVNSWTSPS